MKLSIYIRQFTLCISLFTFSLCNFSCSEFIEIDPPRTDLVREAVFANDATTIAAISNVYFQMQSGNFAGGALRGISFICALSSDEMLNYNTSSFFAQNLNQFNQNSLLANNSFNADFWSELYQYIYKANAIIEGLSSSTGVSENLKKQVEGEAKFIRAFSHFYLVNLYGDVPLTITTDYIANQSNPKTPKADVYQQIIADLKDAQNLLAEDYSFSSNERVRPNKWAATALLARVYLFTEDWINAEAEASAVINNTTRYNLADLNNVFFKNSEEAIWQLSNAIGGYPQDIFTFYIFGAPTNGALQSDFVNAFEAGDSRKNLWISSVGSAPYYFPIKYQSFTSGTEYSTILRLAEQYLIRAEARAKQGKIMGANSAESDINVIRNRAGLANTEANTETAIVAAIEQERKVELFTEWGHRWLDLKRAGLVDAVLGPIKPQWVSTAALYPIPESQVLNSPIIQNAGY